MTFSKLCSRSVSLQSFFEHWCSKRHSANVVPSKRSANFKWIPEKKWWMNACFHPLHYMIIINSSREAVGGANSPVRNLDRCKKNKSRIREGNVSFLLVSCVNMRMVTSDVREQWGDVSSSSSFGAETTQLSWVKTYLKKVFPSSIKHINFSKKRQSHLKLA